MIFVGSAAHSLTQLAKGTVRPTMQATAAASPQAPQHRWLQQGAGWALELSGDWRGAAGLALSAPGADVQGQVAVLTQGLSAWDGGLAAALRERLAPLARAGVVMQLDALPEDVRSVLSLALPAAGSEPPAAAEPPPGALVVLGERAMQSGHQALVTATFFGEVLLSFGRLLGLQRERSGLRLSELLRQVDQTGPLSIPIVSLTCFLIGLMLAYMGGAQLDRIGAQRYIADIVTVGMVRELAGLMTGMILAGRIGSAFAAQLATMKAGEEIDALRALGVDPIDHLVLPRVLAVVLMAPLVWAYASLVGVLAGLLPTTTVYAVPAAEYLNQALSALTWTHLWIGLFKTMLYGALLALAGCREGLHAGRNAQAVGEATTTGVVKGLVWVIAAACATTVVFQSLGY